MRIFISVLILTICSSLNGQDAVYSQYYNSNSLLNPALTGVFDGSQRFALHYRSQWRQTLPEHALNTYSAQFDAKINTVRQDYFSYGVDFTRDQSGAAKYTQQTGHLNLGYIKQIGASRYSSTKHFLVGAAKLGIGQNRMDLKNLWFGNQFDFKSSSVNQNLDSNEQFLNAKGQTPMYGDLGMGLMYYSVMSDRKSFFIGLAGQHLSQPKISLTEFGNFRLKRLFTVHAGGEIPFNRELSILPNVAAMKQGPSMMLMPGFHLRYTHKDWREIAMRAGVWTRIARAAEQGITNDALIFSTTFEYEAWMFGFSYDITTNQYFNANNGRGAFEFSIQYRNRDVSLRRPVRCPRM